MGITPIGLSLPALSQPLALGFYLNDSLLLGVESGAFTVSLDSSDVTGNISYTNQGMFARWWVGNSFNLLGGYYQREFSGTATANETIISGGQSVQAEATGSVTSKASVVSLGLGNQWQFNFGLVIGCDWAIYNQVLNHAYSSSITTNTGYANTSEAEQALADAEPAYKKLHQFPGLVHFYLGFAF